MLHQPDHVFKGGIAITPLSAFFDGVGANMLIPNAQAERHMDLAQGYLTENLEDKGEWIGWDMASPGFFTGQGGIIPPWAQERADQVMAAVPEDDAEIFVEYLLNDPFMTARDSHTGRLFRFALWDGAGKDAIEEGASPHTREIRFDWRTILPQRLAMSAFRQSV